MLEANEQVVTFIAKEEDVRVGEQRGDTASVEHLGWETTPVISPTRKCNCPSNTCRDLKKASMADDL